MRTRLAAPFCSPLPPSWSRAPRSRAGKRCVPRAASSRSSCGPTSPPRTTSPARRPSRGAPSAEHSATSSSSPRTSPSPRAASSGAASNVQRPRRRGAARPALDDRQPVRRVRPRSRSHEPRCHELEHAVRVQPSLEGRPEAAARATRVCRAGRPSRARPATRSGSRRSAPAGRSASRRGRTRSTIARPTHSTTDGSGRTRFSWRVRAVRSDSGRVHLNGLPAVSYGPWSPDLRLDQHAAVGRAAAARRGHERRDEQGRRRARARADARVRMDRRRRANGIGGTGGFGLYRVYISTDSDCVNIDLQGRRRRLAGLCPADERSAAAPGRRRQVSTPEAR